MAKKPGPIKFKQAILKYRGVVLTAFAMLCLFLISTIIYKHFPFTLPSEERRTLSVLIPLGLLTLVLYFPYGWAAARLGSLRARIDISRLVNKGTSAFGALAFWLNRAKIDLKAETKREELEEAERKKEFGENFPKINRIPVVRQFAKWMYKEGTIYLLILLLIIILGGALRLYNLSNLSLHQDEIFFPVSAKNYQDFDKLQISWNGMHPIQENGEYTRASSLVKILSTFWEQFGYTEAMLRLPSAIAGILLIILSYIVFRQIIGKNIALLSSFMIAIDQHYIYMSRFSRDYAFLALVSILLVWLVYKIFHTPNKTPLKRVIYILSFFALIFFGLHLNFQIFLIFPGITLYVLGYVLYTAYKYKKRRLQLSTNQVIIISIITFSLLFLGIYVFREFAVNVWHDLFETKIFTSDPKFLYYRALFDTYKLPILALLLSFTSLGYFYYNKRALIILFPVIISLPVLIYITKWAPSFRYILTLRVFSIAIIAIGVYYLYHLFLKRYATTVSRRSIVILLFVLFFLNPSIPNVAPIPHITEKAQTDWHHGDGIGVDIGTIAPNFRSAYDYIKKHYQDGDIIMTRDLSSFYYLGPLFQDNPLPVYYIERGADSLIFLDNNIQIPFRQLVDSGERIWLVTGLQAYLSQTIRDYIESEMINLSPFIEGVHRIKYINYRGEFVDELYWPSVYVSTKKAIIRDK